MQVSGATAGRTTAAGSGGSAIVSDYTTFLKLLTTQMQNQDPLNPIDSSDYAVQLATFSGVEQQTKTNDLLTAMQSGFGLLGMGQMAGWVGREARSLAPVQITDARPVTLLATPPSGADRLVMVVEDADGTVVNRVDLPADTTEFIWEPVDLADQPLVDGRYVFTLESYRDETQLGAAEMASYQRVTELRSGPTGLSLLLEGGVEIGIGEVTAVRG
ncbi:flagellar basal-body rod modification protein FlgD [Gemmobacter aquatilis]|uniref:Basal-body rod modification protein FlgD n=1 Tax=Gemmobacter aquatilis TaxID=933059 RepID=A0A1H7YJQ9_9RHOB|nr:flagellar hook capping FlgD N-terminal domain-containing protein [Gemmobacter aquatilis]SEM46064.1 flagellar basal-body rod modification protein FlgD [Gemmobacter aquatilis]